MRLYFCLIPGCAGLVIRVCIASRSPTEWVGQGDVKMHPLYVGIDGNFAVHVGDSPSRPLDSFRLRLLGDMARP